MQGPSSFDLVSQLIVFSGNQGTGIFLYNGTPGLGNPPVMAAVAPGVTTDPYGNTVTAVMYIGSLTGSHIQWDQTGTTTLFDSSGHMRLELLSATGRIEFFNAFGAVVFLIAPDLGALFFYQDLGSATQGSAIGAEVWSTSGVTDPITSRGFSPGFTNLDPIAAGFLQLTPGNIAIGNFASMSNQGHIAGIGGSGAVQGFLGFGGGAPFATPTANHATMQMFQTSPDASRTPQFLFAATSGGTFLAPSTLAFIEIQNIASQTAIRVIQPAALGFPVFAALVTGDTNDRLTIDESGKHQWGPGNAGVDLAFARTGAGQSALTGATANGTYLLTVKPSTTGVGGLGVFMGNTIDFAISAGVAGDPTADPRWVVLSSGQHEWSSGAAAPDCFLSRAAVGRMAFSGTTALDVSGVFNVPNAATNPHFGIDLSGQIYTVDSGAHQTVWRTGANLCPNVNIPSGDSYDIVLSRLTDTVAHTVTAATPTQIANTWNVSLNDAVVGTTYRLCMRGHGVQGSTAQTLTINGFFSAAITVPVANLAANAAFTWQFDSEFVVKSTGAAGTADVSNKLTLSTGASTPSVVFNSQSRAVAYNTTVTNNGSGQANWGATTGAPTITCDDNWFERVC